MQPRPQSVSDTGAATRSPHPCFPAGGCACVCNRTCKILTLNGQNGLLKLCNHRTGVVFGMELELVGKSYIFSYLLKATIVGRQNFGMMCGAQALKMCLDLYLIVDDKDALVSSFVGVRGENRR